ncbi:hypothetical protein M569_03284 [Genlisea aurea]|uniref:O-fucosyltransferase family protein n=1 Tax=Genlisea aurea TaxID=192259 RepID=S8E6L8_9LAMI|nr:hypothetical protein M569_03284 [Genlisea aurea]
MRKTKLRHQSNGVVSLKIIQSQLLSRRLIPPHYASAILLLLAATSFLLAALIHRRVTCTIDGDIIVGSDPLHDTDKSDGVVPFRVPMEGGRSHLWWSSINSSRSFYGCSNASASFSSKTSRRRDEEDRFLIIYTSGGLNQQRTGIVDAVVAAYILNVTLVIPKLDEESFWNDSSNFSEIFDTEWFIASLEHDVKIVEHLPEGRINKVVKGHVPRKCDPECYRNHVSKVFDEKRAQAVELKKFDFRLSNKLKRDLQKLRCRVNYHALRFTQNIASIGMRLVERMRSKSDHFMALHLRHYILYAFHSSLLISSY